MLLPQGLMEGDWVFVVLLGRCRGECIVCTLGLEVVILVLLLLVLGCTLGIEARPRFISMCCYMVARCCKQRGMICAEDVTIWNRVWVGRSRAAPGSRGVALGMLLRQSRKLCC